jgi:hypothetical protein
MLTYCSIQVFINDKYLLKTYFKKFLDLLTCEFKHYFRNEIFQTNQMVICSPVPILNTVVDLWCS